MDNKKYIVISIDGKESIFTFPKTVDHDRMYEAITAIRFGSDQNWNRKLRLSKAISAGFVDGGECYGRSETLNIESRGDLDTLLLGE